MPTTLLPYWRLLVAGVRQQSTYRLAALGGILANTTFGLLRATMMVAAVGAAGGELQGYDRGQVLAYTWVAQAMLGSVNLYGRSRLAARVKDGSVAVDFLRPLDVQAAEIAAETGRAVWNLVPRGLPMIALGLLTGMTLPTWPWAYPLGLVSVLLGIVLSCVAVYLVAVAGFWVVETRGLQVLYMTVSGFLAGLFVPVHLFPAWLQSLAHATPFPSMLMSPVDVLSGRASGSHALALVAGQLAWLAVLGAVGAVMTRAGRRRLEVQGG